MSRDLVTCPCSKVGVLASSPPVRGVALLVLVSGRSPKAPQTIFMSSSSGSSRSRKIDAHGDGESLVFLLRPCHACSFAWFSSSWISCNFSPHCTHHRCGSENDEGPSETPLGIHASGNIAQFAPFLNCLGGPTCLESFASFCDQCQ